MLRNPSSESVIHESIAMCEGTFAKENRPNHSSLSAKDPMSNHTMSDGLEQLSINDVYAGISVGACYKDDFTSNHSSTSIRSYSSCDSYTSSVKSARGIPDEHKDNRFNGVKRHNSSVSYSGSQISPGGLFSSHHEYRAQDCKNSIIRPSAGEHQTWEEFCDLQLVAFLQMCTMEDVHALTLSVAMLNERFKLHLKRMFSQEGNLNFLSYRASPKPGQPEAQFQLLRHHQSIFSQSRSSIRSHNSHASYSSTSTTSSFSSQISDGTMQNHVQQEAMRLKDCITKIQKKLKYLEKEPHEAQDRQTDKGEEDPAAKSTSMKALLEINETAIQFLEAKEGHLRLLGFSDISLLFAKFQDEFRAVYKDLKGLKRNKRLSRWFGSQRSRQDAKERNGKYYQVEQIARAMLKETSVALEIAEAQKDNFIAAGRPYASTLILECTAELGYAPYDKYTGPSKHKLVTREFVKIGDPKLVRRFICECCPKKPKKFGSLEELSAHEQEKQYECAYCPHRFKDQNEAQRHTNSLHLRRHSWSCGAISSYEAVFHPSPGRPHEVDTCGYCGENFERTGQVDDLGMAFASETDWELRINHLIEVHKYGECNHAKKFFRVDHFRQHLKHSHAGTSGKWTNMLENACMKDEPLPEPVHKQPRDQPMSE